MSTDRKRSTNALQGIAALVGITLGVIPLIGVAVGRGPGLLAVLIGDTEGSARWWVPAAVLIVCVVIIAVLERSANR